MAPPSPLLNSNLSLKSGSFVQIPISEIGLQFGQRMKIAVLLGFLLEREDSFSYQIQVSE